MDVASVVLVDDEVATPQQDEELAQSEEPVDQLECVQGTAYILALESEKLINMLIHKIK